MLVFISSTITDLKEERSAVEEVLQQIDLKSFASEKFIASSESPRELCLRKASECDIFVGIYKNRYGFIPKEENQLELSVPEMEYDMAVMKNKPRILFEYYDDKNKEPRMKKFLKKIKDFTNGNFIKNYRNIDDLKYNLLVSLVFEIFKLDKVLKFLDFHTSNYLQKFVKDEINYKDFLYRMCKYLDFRGLSSLKQIIHFESESLFVTPYLQYVGNSLYLNYNQDEKELYDTEIPTKIIDKYEINLLFPISLSISNDTYFLIDRENHLQNKKSLLDIIKEQSNIVILGSPGIGKTSILKKHILSLLNKNDSYFPIFFLLSEFGIFINQNPHQSLINYFNKKYHNLGFSNNFILSHLESGNCIVMCDGLDEVFDIKLRKLIVQKIEEFSSRYAKNNKIIITSRLNNYNESIITGFEHYFINRLNKDQILEYLGKWHNLIRDSNLNKLKDNSEIDAIKDQLKVKIQTDKSILELSRIPLFLSLLCLLYSYNVTPNKKIDLYENYLNLLFRVLDENKLLDRKEHPIGQHQLRRVVENIANWFYEYDFTKCTEYEIKEFLKTEFLKMKVDDNLLDDYVDAFLKIVGERTGLFIESNYNEYSFIHFSFMDYLVACNISRYEIPLICDILFRKKNIQRNYEIIRFVFSILNKQSTLRLKQFIEYMLLNRISYENFVHIHLILILHSMRDNIRIDIELLQKIIKEIKIVLKHNDRYTIQYFDRPLAYLLSSTFKRNIEEIIDEFENEPTIVLNILMWYEYDLFPYENIIRKCFKKLEGNTEYLIYFLLVRLKKKDKLGINLAIDLLKQKTEGQFDSLLKQKIESQFDSLLKQKYEQEQQERYEQKRREIEELRKQLVNFTLGASFNSMKPILSNFSSNWQRYLGEDWKERDKIEYEQFKKLLSSFSPSDLYSLNPHSIFNKKRRLLILLFYLSKEQKNINNQLLNLIEIDSFEFKTDLIKLYFFETKQLPKIIQEKTSSNEVVKNIVENYEFISKFKSLQLINALKTILKFSPSFGYIASKTIEIYYQSLGTYLLEPLIKLSIQYAENSINDCYYIIKLITDYSRKGNITLIGPLSGMATRDNPDNISLKKKQVLDLIDCSCALNPKLDRREDVLEDFDPNSFVRLKQVINDTTQIKSIRSLALEIYCEKFNDDQSFNLLCGLLNDSQICYDAARIIIKKNGQKEIIDNILSNNKLEIAEKKILLTHRFNYNFES